MSETDTAPGDLLGVRRPGRPRKAEAGNGSLAAAFPRYRVAPLAELVPYATNARTHSRAQIDKIAASLREFGFTNPVLTDGKRGIIAGHGRVLAAEQIGMQQVPTIELRHLTAAQKRAYVLADNRLAEDAGWDRDLLAIELGELRADGFDLALTGFELGEIGKLIGAEDGAGEGEGEYPETIPEVPAAPVTRLGDVWRMGAHRLVCGDVRTALAALPDDAVQCVVTSPPYFGLRDYGTGTWAGGDPACDHTGTRREHSPADKQATSAGSSRDPVSRECRRCGATRTDAQIGLEASPDAFLAELVAVFREVRRVLRPDGVCFVNMGDSYNNFRAQMGPGQGVHGRDDLRGKPAPDSRQRGWDGLKEKDLLMVPARLALALQADGWWLRSDIIWHKPNPMPESVTDRPTSAHEHVFMLTKSESYFWDAEAVAEPLQGEPHAPGNRKLDPGGKASSGSIAASEGQRERIWSANGTRNIRNVWTIATAPYADAHFATFPPALAERCIRAGSKPDDAVLDPFGGAFTTGIVAARLDRACTAIELSPAYCDVAVKRWQEFTGQTATREADGQPFPVPE
jgi:DNA modification methylase